MCFTKTQGAVFGDEIVVLAAQQLESPTDLLGRAAQQIRRRLVGHFHGQL
ncbi:MAG TPA: hypothetical protein VNH11_15165 [Pirellulales bacterium]|nr:hypothetical protein [Pirellulales bacterium]